MHIGVEVIVLDTQLYYSSSGISKNKMGIIIKISTSPSNSLNELLDAGMSRALSSRSIYTVLKTTA